MKFTLSTSKSLYHISEDKEQIDRLTGLGFSFAPYIHVKDCFIIEGGPLIELSNIQDIVDFSKKYGRIIIDEDDIEIYNDYRE